MMQETTSALHRMLARRVPPARAIRLLKRRRDDLLNRSCSRPECAEIMAEVREINREVDQLERELCIRP